MIRLDRHLLIICTCCLVALNVLSLDPANGEIERTALEARGGAGNGPESEPFRLACLSPDEGTSLSRPGATQPAAPVDLEDAKTRLKAAVDRGDDFEGKARYVEAAVEYEKAVALAPSVYGDASVETAQLLNNLAYLYKQAGRYAQAEPLDLRSLAIIEAKLGKDHPAVARSLHNLAALYELMGQYAKAESLCLRSLAIREAARGKDHPDVAQSLTLLAVLYHEMGQFAKAEPLFLRSQEIWEAKLGKDHLVVAGSLNNLALLYHAMAQYAKAEQLFLRSLAIREDKLGKDHPVVAQSLNNLALVYRAMAQYAKAESLYVRSLEIKEATLGKDHPEVATSLNNLGVLYQSMGQSARAEPLLLRSLAIREAKLGKDHPAVATTLHNLVNLYESMDQYAKAEPLHLRSLAIREATLGKDHPDVAGSLNNLALTYQSMEQYAKAEPLLLRSLEIREAKLGKDHLETALVLRNLSGLYEAIGDLERSWAYAQRAEPIYLRARASSSASALARSAFSAERGAGSLLPYLALKFKKPGVFDLLERGQAVGLRELLAQSRVETAAGLPREDQERVTTAMARINALGIAIDRNLSKALAVEDLREELRRAEREYDALMVELSQRHEQFVAAETAKAITSERMVASPALDGQTAIVGWLSFRDSLWGYVVRRSGVKWVDLSKGYVDKDENERVMRILAAGRSPNEAVLGAADLAALYGVRLKWLEPHLADVKKLIIIAQGRMAHLPLEMLLTRQPAGDERDMARWPWLGSKYQISYAPSCTTLDILCRQREERKRRPWDHRLFALGDPPFSQDQLAAMKAEETTPAVYQVASGGVSDRAIAALREAVRFDANAVPPRLPATRWETQMLADVLGRDKSILLLGPQASERELFKASESGELAKCRYVHLATHGLADSDRPELSALVLARVPADKDYDGVLQMREVFHLKLGADLVVLSACQTGLGKNLRGEGMVGLSTAFFFAGTPSLVISLWSVPDASTALLMQRFYRNLQAGQTKAAALQEAKAWLGNLTRSDLVKLGRAEELLGNLVRGFGQPTTAPKGQLAEEKPFAHPHYWAGFILTGDPQ